MAVTAEQGVGTGTNSGAVAWVNPGNIVVAGSPFSDTGLVLAGGNSGFMQATNFGFGAAGVGVSDNIDGVEMRFNRATQNVNTTIDNDIRLFWGGAVKGADQSLGGFWPSGYALAYAAYGGAANLWGATPTASDVRSSGFGCSIPGLNPHGLLPTFMRIDTVKMTVYFTEIALGRPLFAQIVGVLPAAFLGMLAPFLFKSRSVTRSAGLVRAI